MQQHPNRRFRASRLRNWPCWASWTRVYSRRWVFSNFRYPRIANFSRACLIGLFAHIFFWSYKIWRKSSRRLLVPLSHSIQPTFQSTFSSQFSVLRAAHTGLFLPEQLLKCSTLSRFWWTAHIDPTRLGLSQKCSGEWWWEMLRPNLSSMDSALQ